MVTKTDAREMFKQAKPVRPGPKRDQQQQQQHKLDKNRKTNICQAAAQKSRYVFHSCHDITSRLNNQRNIDIIN